MAGPPYYIVDKLPVWVVCLVEYSNNGGYLQMLAGPVNYESVVMEYYPPGAKELPDSGSIVVARISTANDEYELGTVADVVTATHCWDWKTNRWVNVQEQQV